jgi:hypothetical protein
VTTGSGVKTGHLQNGAVTDAKISGTISSSKLNVGTAAGTVAAGNHVHAPVPPQYANVVIVAQSGGNFTSVRAAVASITNATETNRVLVKIMPGVYDLGTTSLEVPLFVDLEGSGTETTKLTGAFATGEPADYSHGLVMASAVRSLTIENRAVGVQGTALANNGNGFVGKFTDLVVRATGASVNIGISNISHGIYRNVTTIASGPALKNYAMQSYVNASIFEMTAIASDADFSYGIYFFSTFTTRNLLRSSTVTVSGGQAAHGVGMYDSIVDVDNVRVLVNPPLVTSQYTSAGIDNDSYTCHFCVSTVANSSISAPTTFANNAFYSYTSLHISGTKLDGGPAAVSGGASSKCFGTYDGVLNPISCQ